MERKAMFRPIRRKKKEMDIDAAKELLQCSRRGVLAVNGDDGYPYACLLYTSVYAWKQMKYSLHSWFWQRFRERDCVFCMKMKTYWQ